MAARKNEAKWIEARQRWQINVMNEGERKTFTSSTPGKKGKIEAEKKADKWLKEGLIGETTKVGDLLDRWYGTLVKSTSEAHYRQQDSYIRNWIKPVIGNKKIGKLSVVDLQEVIDNAYHKGNLAEKTLKNIRATLMAFVKYCRAIPCTTLFPEGLRIPKGAKVSEKKIIVEEDVKKLFSSTLSTYRMNVVEDFWVYAYRFVVVNGIRPGELIGLKWSDINGNKLTINRSINDRGYVTQGKNKNARRTILLPAIAQEILLAQKDMLKANAVSSAYVFPEKNGEHLSQENFRTNWKRYCAYNNIDNALTPYEMRHTFVSIMDEMPEGLKKMVVGHSKSMDTEGVYGHEKAGDRERAAAYVDAAFSRILRS